MLREAAFDTSFQRGRPDRRLHLRRAGRFAAVEADPDGDGTFERLSGEAARPPGVEVMIVHHVAGVGRRALHDPESAGRSPIPRAQSAVGTGPLTATLADTEPTTGVLSIGPVKLAPGIVVREIG